ncbi:MAG: DEAD/DEAH box helicase family protein [Eubacterium sp.]|nr:DEAD/DEAH box helicase family protein [Eubacterium sp.]
MRKSTQLLDIPYETEESAGFTEHKAWSYELPFRKCGSYDISEVLSICLYDKKGIVDIYYCAKLAGVSEQAIVDYYIGKAVIQIPGMYAFHRKEYEDYILIVQYLQGNLYDLLNEVEQYNEQFEHRFDINEAVILKHMPEIPSIYDIHTQLGATWISENTIAAFIKDLLHLPIEPKVKTYKNKRRIDCPILPYDIYNREKFGTDRMSALKILDHILNASTIKVKDEVPADNASGKKMVVNKIETQIAEEKKHIILREFDKWCKRNKIIIKSLIRQYCDMYAYTIPKYDGSFLKFSDMNPEVTFYQHQKDGVARAILSDTGTGSNVVYCHDVGSGKTYIIVATAHELKRLGLSEKNMIVVPNNVFGDAVRTHKYLYPQDKLLTISPEDFTPKNREEIIHKIKTEDYTAIYICYSKFDMLSLSYSYYLESMQEEQRELNDDYRNIKDRWARKVISGKLDNIKKKKEKLEKEYTEDVRCCFDELGITSLFIDEAHNYKNCSIDTRLEGVIGMHRKGSNKADLLLDKVRCVQKKKGNVFFYTGTLLTNSIADLFVFQDYLQHDTLRNCSIATFGEWASTFCSIINSFEIDVDSTNFRYTTRLSSYHNLPELMSVAGGVCDFYHNSPDDMPLPIFNGYKDIVVEQTKYHEEYNKIIVDRVDEIRTGNVPPDEDNILMLITDGRKISLDARHIYSEAVIQENECKAGACAKEAAKIYKEHPGTTQIIFCDYSTPKDGFNVYDEVKKYLIKNGVKAKEIAFIQEGTTENKKQKLLKHLNDGEIRVMLGSTSKLGVGVNVQENLIAIHHLDAPWRPSDISQREGRLIRQGNKNEEVFIFRYLTSGSFDAYVWQLLENKRKFIGDFLKGSLSEFHRDESEIDTVMLDYSEVKALALGNSKIRNRIQTFNKLERAKISKKYRYKQLGEMSEKVKSLKSQIKKTNYKIHVVTADKEYYNEKKEKVTREERIAFGEDLIEALNENIKSWKEQIFQDYMGFDVILPEDMTLDDRYVILRRRNGGSYKVAMNDRTPLGVTQALDATLLGLSKRVLKLKRLVTDYENELEESLNEIAKGNIYDDEVEELEAKLAQLDRELTESLEKK